MIRKQAKIERNNTSYNSKSAADPQPMDLDCMKSKNPPWICYNCNKCHALPRFDPTELHHTCTHLTMDCDLTQSRHHHAGQCGTVSNLAISDISGHLWTGRDGMLTACAPHSATSFSTYFLIQLITLMYIHI